MNEFETAERNESRATMKRSNTTLAKTRSVRTSTGMLLLSMLLGGLFLTGCAGGTSTSTPPPVSGTVYTYQGVTNVSLSQTYIPLSSFILESAEGSFSYNSYGGQAAVVPALISGTYSSDHGYLDLTAFSGQTSTTPAGQLANAGYALTIPGEAALLRPGNNTTAPVIAAGMNSCPLVSSGETLLFVALPSGYWSAAGSAAYGSIQASTNATGETWTFSKQSQSLLAGSGSPPAYPTSFTGTCGQGVSGYSIGVLPTVMWGSYDPQIFVSPSGFFTEETTGSPLQAGSGAVASEVQQPLVGVIAPSSALDTTALVAGKYLGLMYDAPPAIVSGAPTETQLVSFGSAVAGSGTTMTGGVFPNDDPSQTPAANITVNFGAQSATQNGLYTGVTVTTPNTTGNVANCTKNGGTAGTGANGSLTCSFQAVAIAGNPNNKFAIFLVGVDPTQNGAPFGLYLYQQ